MSKIKVKEQLEKADSLDRDSVKNFYELTRDAPILSNMLRIRYGDTFMDRVHERAVDEGIKDEWEKEHITLVDAALLKLGSYLRGKLRV